MKARVWLRKKTSSLSAMMVRLRTATSTPRSPKSVVSSEPKLFVSRDRVVLDPQTLSSTVAVFLRVNARGRTRRRDYAVRLSGRIVAGTEVADVKVAACTEAREVDQRWDLEVSLKTRLTQKWQQRGFEVDREVLHGVCVYGQLSEV
mmetsp:Transcript_12487/g.31825  ORF Transcript_12487/g.31825 Transcript_12487/m.31825 type:complete len:147 (-) Transcript_12487:68-508(-)